MIEFLESPWAQRVIFGLGGLTLGFLFEYVVVDYVHKLAERTRFKWDDLLLQSLKGLPTVWVAAAGFYLALGVGEVDPQIERTGYTILTVVAMGAAVIALMRLVGGMVESFSNQAATAGVQSPTLVVNLAKLAVGVMGAFLILQNLGVEITPIITALGIGGLAVALALQDTLGNLFAGVQIILTRMVRSRDYVRLSSGEEGWVTDVRARHTTIETFPDGNLVTVPNAVLASATVKNYTFPRKALWVSVQVGVSYSSDLEHVEAVAREVGQEVLGEVKGGVQDQTPIILYQQFGASSIDFEVRLKVRDFRSQGPVRHEFIKRLHKRFGTEGIEIPFPIRTVIMKGQQPT
ncbi:MAG: mechanosensitive ion channel family protein [Gemmatimonadota bacterium]|jgi:small-conductance mechanosensitive channel